MHLHTINMILQSKIILERFCPKPPTKLIDYRQEALVSIWYSFVCTCMYHDIECQQQILKSNRILKSITFLGIKGIARRIWPKMTYATCVKTGGFAHCAQLLQKSYMTGIKLVTVMHVATGNSLVYSLWIGTNKLMESSIYKIQSPPKESIHLCSIYIPITIWPGLVHFSF